MNNKTEGRPDVIPYLLSPHAIRDRCEQILELAKKGGLQYFNYNPSQLKSTAQYVADVILENYPKLDIPYHSRWRHFDLDGFDRVAWLNQQRDGQLSLEDPLEWGRILYDLVITSVLLDAGAGPDWSYIDEQTQKIYSRSEGLAIASFVMFKDGLFSFGRDSASRLTAGRHSEDSQMVWRVDSKALIHLTPEKLGQAFQISKNNPLLGLEGRTSLLNQLGKALENHPKYFGEPSPRLGNLFDYFVSCAQNNHISMLTIFDTILKAFGSIWPGRTILDDVNLGDCWSYPLLKKDDPNDELIPFHKLSQWLSYSLVEPLEEYGIQVDDIDQLTGLAEYRNGGLFLDMGLIELKNKKNAQRNHRPGSILMIEWRALTIVSLDLIADEIRSILSLDKSTFPLAKILQGGTWEAGRKIATKLREGGPPPITIESDGTVF